MKWLDTLIDNSVLRDESEPNKPVLSLKDQPLWLQIIIKILYRG